MTNMIPDLDCLDDGVIDIKFDVIAIAEVQCHYPCVPECTRNHEWSKS